MRSLPCTFTGSLVCRLVTLAALALWSWSVPYPCMAAPNAAAQIEIDHLFGYLAQSACRFNRNGTWYSTRDARDHLKKKYDYLSRKGLVSTAESFIEQAASKSSVSGEPYLVACPGAAAQLSELWFKDELVRFRRTNR
jgi:hypothetical protein